MRREFFSDLKIFRKLKKVSGFVFLLFSSFLIFPLTAHAKAMRLICPENGH